MILSHQTTFGGEGLDFRLPDQRTPLLQQEQQYSNRSNNPSEMSGVAQNLQAFIQNVTGKHELPVVSTQKCGGSKHGSSGGSQQTRKSLHFASQEEQPIVHYPYQKREDRIVASCPSDRSNVAPKQVRFDIREGLKQIISSVEAEQMSSNNVLTTAGDENDARSMNVQRVPIAKRPIQHRVTKLKFQRGLQRENSQSNSRSPSQKSRGPSQESKQNSDNQMPRKLQKAKSRQLALKYKRTADKMKYRKFGIEPPISYLNLDETNYSSVVSSTKNLHDQQDSRETPSFSLAVSKRDLQQSIDSDSSQEQIEMAPRPMLHVPPSIETEEQYEEINHHEGVLQRMDSERSIGMIIKNQSIVQKSMTQYVQSRESSRVKEQDRQPGQIVRQRSMSPALSLQFQAQNKLRQAQSPTVGFIVRNQSQQQLVNRSLPSINFQRMQTSPERNSNSSFSYIPMIADSSRRHESPQVSLIQPPKQEANLFKYHCFGTIWDLINGDEQNNSDQAKYQLMLHREHSHSLRTNLLDVLSRDNLSNNIKLQMLRSTLTKLIVGSVAEEACTLVDLRERRDARKYDLKQAMRLYLKSGGMNTHEQLKSQLLRDIVDRLNQKIAVQALKVNSHIKRELNMHFSTYYQEFIASTYKKRALQLLKAYASQRKSQREYLENAQNSILEFKKCQIFSIWRNIRFFKIQLYEKLESAQISLNSSKLRSCLISWKVVILHQRNKHINTQILLEWFKLKYRRQVFAKWVFNLRQSNKIKRKALQLVQKGSTQLSSNNALVDELWYKAVMNKALQKFQSSVQDYYQEIEFNKELIARLQTLKCSKEPTSKQFHSNQSNSRRFNSTLKLLVQDPIIHQTHDVRRSLDLKYQIHSALVLQQNNNSCQKTRASSGSRETRAVHYVSDGEKHQRMMIPKAQKAINFERQVNSNHNSVSSPPNNQLFRMLEEQLSSYNRGQYHSYNRQLSVTYDESQTIPLDQQVREHLMILLQKQKDKIPRVQHYITSLKANANDVLNKEDFTSITDYIQYGIATANSGQVFSSLFQTRALSTLFQQWRTRYQSRTLHRVLHDSHTVSLGKQVFTEWKRTLQRRKLAIKQFQRMKQMEKFYRVFKVWSQYGRQLKKVEDKECRIARKRVLFNAWTKYMENQGDLLVKILKAQSYSRQALLSKSLLALYKNHLKSLRARRFRNSMVFSKFFSKLWRPLYRRQCLLRGFITRQQHLTQVNERMKYQIEFDQKRDTLREWKQRVSEKQEFEQMYQAQTQQRQALIAKTFYGLKKVWLISKAFKTLQNLTLRKTLFPAFKTVQDYSQRLMKSQTQFSQYRLNFGVTKMFIGWKEYTIKMKLAKLIYQKRIIKYWRRYVRVRNHLLPRQYRQKRLKAVFLSHLTMQLKAKWNDKRSDIISRQLLKKKRERTLKIVFLKLLENVLQAKKHQIIIQTVRDYRCYNLAERALRALKRRWLKRKKRRLMNQVARDFNEQSLYRRDERLKESLISSTNDYDALRLRDLQVLEDPVKMQMYRALTSWKMYVQDRYRRQTVLERYSLFRQRMTSLRCFLGWRSIAKYAQSSVNQSHDKHFISHQTSRAPTTEGQSPRNYVLDKRAVKQSRERSDSQKGSVRFANDTRAFLFDPKVNLMNITQESYRDSIGGPASATFGQRSLVSNYERIPSLQQTETPRDLQHSSSLNEQPGTSSLFNELDTIFQKNRKWLDEQREREDFLKEMASHYNQRLSMEMMSSMKQSQHSLSMSLSSSRR